MDGLFAKNSHVLGPGQVLSGIALQAKTLHVRDGLAWITIEGMPDDHWLSGGDTLTIVPGRMIVIEAEKGICRIDIGPATTQRAILNCRTLTGEPGRAASSAEM
jgi:hypothetical protein